MMTRVTSVLIGKDISRTSSLVIGGSTENIVSGEVVVLDKNKAILSTGATVSDTDTIFIVQGLADTFSYYNTAGTSFTVRKLHYSNPIEGKLVKKFTATTFKPKSEKSVSISAITGPLTASTEWMLRLVYKDVHEKRGQFTKTYRVTASTTTSACVFNAIRALIRADKGARVSVNADNTAALVVTAKEITTCATALTDLDKFSMVDFDAFLTYVDSDGYAQEATGGGAVTATAGEYGTGNWEQIRDLEKQMWGYEGITNRTQYPVILPTASTVVDSVYNMIIIEHDKSYLSPDNQYVKQAPMTTIVCLPVGAGQTTDILGVLNPWMLSVGQTAISFQL
jgi:hypothetical protein